MNKQQLDNLLERDLEWHKRFVVTDYSAQGYEYERVARYRALVLGYRLALGHMYSKTMLNYCATETLLPLFDPPKPTKREQIEEAIKKLQEELSEIVGDG